MSEVEVKLYALRTAADQLRLSAHKIEEAVQRVSGVVQEIVASDHDSSAALRFSSLYSLQKSSMQDWSVRVSEFAGRLNEAADDIAIALADAGFEPTRSTITIPPSMIGVGSGGARRGKRTGTRSAMRKEPNVTLPTFRLDEFIARINRPLYDRLTLEEELLDDQQDRLDELTQSRQDKLEDLAALKNRLLSYDPKSDLSRIPRVVALEEDLSALDQEILTVETRIESLNESVSGLKTRLERVIPGPGADLDKIAALEQGETSPWIKENTHGCVNHVVNKLPVPAGIPSDAHLWDQNAEKFREFGVTTGDTPLPGSVIVLEKDHSYADDVYGHLMYVEKVEGGIVWITDNEHAEPVKLHDLTTELSGSNIKYLYFPWHTQA